MENLAPRLLRPTVVGVGTPFEPYNQTKLAVECAVLEHLEEELRVTCGDSNIELALLTNVTLSASEAAFWKTRGWYSLPSFPDMTLPLPYDSFKDFITHRSSNMRRTIRGHIRKFERSGYRLEWQRDSEQNWRDYFNAYNFVRNRSLVPWIAHSEAYFQKMPSLTPVVELLIALDTQKRPVAFMSYLNAEDVAHAGRFGILPNHHRKHAIYFRLLYALIERAIKENKRELKLEPTTYRLKRRLGAHYQFTQNLLLPVSTVWKQTLPLAPSLGHFLLEHLQKPNKLESSF